MEVFFCHQPMFLSIFWPAAPIGSGTNDSGHATGCELYAVYFLYSKITHFTFQDIFMVPESAKAWSSPSYYHPVLGMLLLSFILLNNSFVLKSNQASFAKCFRPNCCSRSSIKNHDLKERKSDSKIKTPIQTALDLFFFRTRNKNMILVIIWLLIAYWISSTDC